MYIFWPIRHGTGHQRFFGIAVSYSSYIILCFPHIVENIYKLLRTSSDRYKQTTGCHADINLFCVPFINTRYIIILCAYSVIVGLRWFEMFVFIIKYCLRKGISYIMTVQQVTQPHCLGCKAFRRRFAKNRSNTNHLNPSSLYILNIIRAL